MKELIIHDNEAGQRLDKLLRKYLSEAPGSFIYKMLRKKNIVLNGKKATGNEHLKKGDSVKLFLADDTIAKFQASKPEHVQQLKGTVKPDIIYEDHNVLFIGVLQHFFQAGKAHASGSARQKYTLLGHDYSPFMPMVFALPSRMAAHRPMESPIAASISSGSTPSGSQPRLLSINNSLHWIWASLGR